MFHRILVALDQSDVSQQAFATAMAMAKTLNSQLMLVHVLSPAESSFPSPVFAIHGTYPMFRAEDVELHLKQWQAVQDQILEFLQAQTAIATSAGIPTEFTQALGDPGSTICSLARNWNANLIIMGRRGYKGLNELFMGSVSNYVLHHASCSVLTVQGTVDLEVDLGAASPTAASTSNAVMT
ncbi:universal stress protein [Leptolyngbya sp. 7M]|uniref:universal stress protein n=1 Tax=Leptolyngbya sp. 7M TaxID=2812896 RepID=UPI001B8CC2EF|nr:universal stress protein [Leptolyngbya sp. 7M]QYO62129.1 universal stress protein [Leptolyngbya sp. 7M]